ncbi:5-methyltetrahydropteroyltriglutamate--homocysteine S-methyltransferase [Psittacicella gerlachiana]|uniref:5-methyltetrahydropteroyltriglutamate--homocysteine methyltransferase n=1 Tax=Psittacicella gerlachiana TaxID=2028574 RepID=A0A3A1Y7Q3_9GAMM|nr:5-methyltetrahydropteroyltriglutamate--homocysteine S-methyltransferase [Psittacicella gerlachiana]RIY32114.1 5-methyltetrahydropteroyltriglutamate--homocysteine methyltransferase [Psittacicella gerlachiana]
MTRLQAPFRADHVGSFLRPQALIKAREAFQAGKISRDELTAVEDQAIRDLVAKQKEVGLKNLTDGEFRRAYWHLDFFWGLNGISQSQAKTGYVFNSLVTKADSATLTGKISGENHPFVEHYKFLHQLADAKHVARQTIPAPAQLYFELIRDQEHLDNLYQHYATKAELFADLATAYRQVIDDLYAAGCRNLQLDDCTWGAIVDEQLLAHIAQDLNNGTTAQQLQQALKEDFLTVNNLLLTQELPEDLVINTHICRGNFQSDWAAQGGYNAVADALFAKENVDGYYLEFDTERAGDFTPLAQVPQGKQVVLGLLTSKDPTLEDKELIKQRIQEASNYVPLENLHLSCQCGFASTQEGNKLSEQAQWDKIRLINEIVAEVWHKQ